MKKIQCLVLALLMLFTLAACASTPAGSGDTTASTTAATDSSATSNTETTIPDSDPGAPLQLPITAVSMPVITEQTTAEDGTVLFTHIYQDVALIAPDAGNTCRILPVLSGNPPAFPQSGGCRGRPEAGLPRPADP